MSNTDTQFALELAINTLRDRASLLLVQGYDSLADDYWHSANDLDVLLKHTQQEIGIGDDVQIMVPLDAEAN